MSWLQQHPSGKQMPTWSRHAILAACIVLVSGSALVPLWSVARALGTYVTLERTDGNRWQESTAHPMLLLGLLGLVAAVAGIVMSIRLTKAGQLLVSCVVS